MIKYHCSIFVYFFFFVSLQCLMFCLFCSQPFHSVPLYAFVCIVLNYIHAIFISLSLFQVISYFLALFNIALFETLSFSSFHLFTNLSPHFVFFIISFTFFLKDNSSSLSLLLILPPHQKSPESVYLGSSPAMPIHSLLSINLQSGMSITFKHRSDAEISTEALKRKVTFFVFLSFSSCDFNGEIVIYSLI